MYVRPPTFYDFFAFVIPTTFLKKSFQYHANGRKQIFKLRFLKGAYWISSNSSFIQYCDSNIGLFTIAPTIVIALPTLRQQSFRSYSLLKARAKSKGKIIAPSHS